MMKIKIYGALVIIFVSGLSIGFFLGQYVDRTRMHHLMQRGPERVEEMITDRLVRHLDLDVTQTEAVRNKVGQVVSQAEGELRRQRDVMRGKMAHLLTEIRPLLNASQQQILDRMDADDLRPGPPPRADQRPPPPPPEN
jgi:uncharacterized protein YneF (UPF0154 family)